jgi:hypothetical protein
MFQRGDGLAPALDDLHTGGMTDVLTVVLLAAPWLAAVVWACRRGGLPVLLGSTGEAFPSQADQLRAFGAR